MVKPLLAMLGEGVHISQSSSELPWAKGATTISQLCLVQEHMSRGSKEPALGNTSEEA